MIHVRDIKIIQWILQKWTEK